jgi:hypothetical protein
MLLPTHHTSQILLPQTFGVLKDAICGKRFGSDDEVIEEVKKYMTVSTIFTPVQEGDRSLAPCRH